MLPATTRYLPQRSLAGAALAPAAVRGYATPAGPPPPGFRLRKPENWDQMEHKETIMGPRVELLPHDGDDARHVPSDGAVLQATGCFPPSIDGRDEDGDEDEVMLTME